ncbi:Fructose-2,6-bisphosphatase [Mortierella sp. AM989]|nr:Fructose-2,6-bisphosphatase [Mortierella sp. AM989]
MSVNPGSRVACVLVGLPGTSKTLVAQKVCRYLQWLGINSKVFSVGNYRRKLFGSYQPHLFFDPTNPEGERSRAEAAHVALADMMAWFRTDQDQDQETSTAFVGIYDATNTTRARRNFLLQECQRNNVQVMFIESVCEDEGIRLANIVEMQKNSPDYAQLDSETAVHDYKGRIGYFKGHYETIMEKGLTYIKLIDAGSQVIVNQIQGYLQSRVVYYLMNLKITPRKIYFSRHGESLFNVMGFLGGDSELSARGKQYARALPSLVATHIPNSDQLTVWTSTKKRTIATAKHLPHPKVAWKALDELEAGKADGLTYEQVEEQFPEDFAKRDDDKYQYRYQDGESYRDVVARLEPVIMDLERQDDILIIGHQAILRCLYAYFMNYSTERLPYIKIPLHTLIQITPGAYSCEERRFKVDIGAVDTHRPKPKAGAGQSNGVNNTAQEHQDDSFTKTAPVATATTVKSPAENEKTLQGSAAPDTPKIILSNLTTNTFRDSIYTSADSLPSKTNARAVSVLPPTATITLATPAPTPATSVKHGAPSSIDLPSATEKAKLITEALMQANAGDSLANPVVAMNLDGIVTPLPEQETGGIKGPILGLDTGSNNNIVRPSSLDSVSTPPLSPVLSLVESTDCTEDDGIESDRVAAEDNCAINVDNGNGDGSFQLSINLPTLAAACV